MCDYFKRNRQNNVTVYEETISSLFLVDKAFLFSKLECRFHVKMSKYCGRYSIKQLHEMAHSFRVNTN